jgi:hypothetical protein
LAGRSNSNSPSPDAQDGDKERLLAVSGFVVGGDLYLFPRR